MAEHGLVPVPRLGSEPPDDPHLYVWHVVAAGDTIFQDHWREKMAALEELGVTSVLFVGEDSIEHVPSFHIVSSAMQLHDESSAEYVAQQYAELRRAVQWMRSRRRKTGGRTLVVCDVDEATSMRWMARFAVMMYIGGGRSPEKFKEIGLETVLDHVLESWGGVPLPPGLQTDFYHRWRRQLPLPWPPAGEMMYRVVAGMAGLDYTELIGEVGASVGAAPAALPAPDDAGPVDAGGGLVGDGDGAGGTSQPLPPGSCPGRCLWR